MGEELNFSIRPSCLSVFLFLSPYRFLGLGMGDVK